MTARPSTLFTTSNIYNMTVSGNYNLTLPPGDAWIIITRKLDGSVGKVNVNGPDWEYLKDNQSLPLSQTNGTIEIWISKVAQPDIVGWTSDSGGSTLEIIGLNFGGPFQSQTWLSTKGNGYNSPVSLPGVATGGSGFHFAFGFLGNNASISSMTTQAGGYESNTQYSNNGSQYYALTAQAGRYSGSTTPTVNIGWSPATVGSGWWYTFILN
jgi:hypothetical protein